MNNKTRDKLQKYFKNRYYNTIFELKDGTKLIIAFPLRKRDPYFIFPDSVYFIFPDDDKEMKRMISVESLVYFEEKYKDFKFNCTFSVVDDKAIMFGRKISENKDEIVDYLMKCLPDVKNIHNDIILLSHARQEIKNMAKKHKEDNYGAINESN